MSLMSRIARGLVSRSQPEAPKPAKPAPVPTSAPSPRTVSRAETRKRISAGVRRRHEPAPPIPPPSPAPACAPSTTLRPSSSASSPTASSSTTSSPTGGHFDEEPEGIEVRGQPLPVLPPAPATLERAVELAAAVAGEKAAAAAELERRRADVEASARWQSPCKAIDAHTGLSCGLMRGHTVNHRHARGEFVRTATGPVSRAVDAAAWANPK